MLKSGSSNEPPKKKRKSLSYAPTASISLLSGVETGKPYSECVKAHSERTPDRDTERSCPKKVQEKTTAELLAGLAAKTYYAKPKKLSLLPLSEAKNNSRYSYFL